MAAQSKRVPKYRLRMVRLGQIAVLLLGVQLSVISQNPPSSTPSQETEQKFEAIVSGIRANVSEGQVSHQNKEGTFDLINGLEIDEGDWIKSGSDARAELLLQPGNYLRLGDQTQFRLFQKQYDRIRLQLDKGTLSLEILKTKDGSVSQFYGPLEQEYELLRIITPASEVLIAGPGLFRIDVGASDGVTKLKVSVGLAFIDGQRVKDKESAISTKGHVEIARFDPKTEDRFDSWCRERAEKLVQANRSLKEEPWVNNRKSGSQPRIDSPSQFGQSGQYVVSAKPASIVFAESGVEISQSDEMWSEVNASTTAKAGDRLKTPSHSRAELMLLPDILLRLDGDSEIRLDQLSDDAIGFTLLRGAVIVDAAKFDQKELPAMSMSGISRSFMILEAGNYRLDVKSGSEGLTVRKGRVTFSGRSIGSCRRIVNGVEEACGKKANDNFHYWSIHRGEGDIFSGKPAATFLSQVRQKHFKSTGFWYRQKSLGYYTFVPFFFEGFESPYGGYYSIVLSPKRGPGIAPLRRDQFELPSRVGLPASP